MVYLRSAPLRPLILRERGHKVLQSRIAAPRNCQVNEMAESSHGGSRYAPKARKWRRRLNYNTSFQLTETQPKRPRFVGAFTNSYDVASMPIRINRNGGKSLPVQGIITRTKVTSLTRSKQFASRKGRQNGPRMNGDQGRTSIIKTGGRGAVHVYTSHFDARSRLSRGKDKTPFKNLHDPKSSLIVPTRGVAQKALDEIRKEVNHGAVNSHRNAGVVGNQLKVLAKVNDLNGERKSVFTGKSIKVTAKNALARRGKATLLNRIQRQKNKQDLTSSAIVQYLPQLPPVQAQSLPEAVVSPIGVKKPVAAKVVISNLHPNVTESDIRELFGAIGELRRATLVAPGLAEVVFFNVEDAFASYSKYNSRNLDGQPMICKVSAVDDEAPTRSTMAPAPLAKKPVVFTVKL